MGQFYGRALPIVWCVWLGTLTGMPYALSFSEPAGAVSFAGAYGFVALGALAGLAVRNATHVKASQAEHRKAWTVLVAAGTALTIVLATLEVMQLLQLGNVLGRLTSGEHVEPEIYPGTVIDILNAAGRHERSIAFFLTFVAMLCRSACKGARPAAATSCLVVGLSAVCGALRPFAALAFYPHPSFPVPAPDIFLGSEDLWTSALPWTILVPVAVATALCLLLVKRASGFLPYVAAGFATGELGMRALERLAPELLGVPLWASLASLVVQFACVAGVCLLVLRAGRAAAGRPMAGIPSIVGSSDTSAPTEVTLELFMGCVGQRETDILVGAGLTPGEVNAVRAAVLDLDSTRTAGLLGVQPSTIRTYRRRACAKLGLTSIEALATDLLRHRGLFAEDSEEQNGKRNADAPRCTAMPGASLRHLERLEKNRHLVAAVCLIGCLGGLSCVLLPYGSAADAWGALLVVAMGIGGGLLLAAGWFGACRAFPRFKAHCESFPVLMLPSVVTVICACVLVAVHSTDAGILLASSSLKLCWVFALAVFTSRGIVGLVGAARRVGDCGRTVAPVPVCVASALGALACLGDAAWVAAFVACTICMLGGRHALNIVSGHAGPKQALDSRGSDGCIDNSPAESKTPLLVLCAFMGFAWEEVWRGQTYVSFQAVCLPACLAIFAAMLWTARRRLTWWFCAIIAVSGLVVASAMSPCAALVMCCLCLAALPAGTVGSAADRDGWQTGDAGGASGHTHASSPDLTRQLIAIACGIGIGIYAVNTFGSYLLRVGEPYSAYRLALSGSTWALLGVLSVAVLLCLLLIARDRRLHLAAGFLSQTVPPERMRSFLTGKGLDTTRAELIALLAEGVSISEAARQLSYSRSATDRMRREAFAVLGLSTRMQLISYLASELHKAPGK